ncbi:MAG: gliding motility-associated C-terminal domain-containing protein [Flavobacteriales bacterium]|nr:gliding motility-associated C-terminal domain-containing protein [Flavobacteriales bacterium]MCB9365279.1 gliding motility-associated C-terminal domain-containing protein [Flavobacteriales bacterium]
MKRFTSIFRPKDTLFIILCLLFHISSFGQYAVNGDASQDNCNCYTLTPNINTAVGSVWNVNLIDLTNSFDYSFNVFLGCSDGGADGMAFGLQPVSTSVGINGNGMGLGTIAPSIGVFLDTYQNTSPDSDPWADHISINSNGDVDHLSANNLAGPVDASSTSSNIEDCAWHDLQIVWTYNSPTSQTLEAYFDGVLRVTYTGDLINSVFSGNPNVFWGFTASTGGASNEHKVCTALNANFGTDITTQTACTNTPINFADSSNSFGSIVNWQWDFGDGSSTVNGTNTTSHTYTSDGNYNAELIITDNSGCKDSIEIPITIASPSVTASADNYNICVGDTIQLNAAIPIPLCEYTIDMSDTYGDGWNGGSLDILINGLSIGNYSVPGPCCTSFSDIQSFNVNDGDNIELIYSSGSFESENSYVLYDASGAAIFTDGPSPSVGSVFNSTASCPNPSYNHIWTPNADFLTSDTIIDPIATPSSDITFTITITDQNNSLCQATDNISITVNQPPTVTNIIETCNPAGDYTVSFDVSGGNGGPYTVTGISPTGITGTWIGNTWTSNTIPGGAAYEFNVDDANGCGPTVVDGTKNCGCITYAGTMDLTPLLLCGDELAIATHNNDSTLDNDDNFFFVLHDSSGTVLGTILNTNTSPSFAFSSPLLNYGSTYYISAVAGNDDLLGGIDYADTCLSISLGTPVTWNEIPTVTDQNPTAYCEDVSGSGTTNNIDLTFWNAAIDGGLGNTISWFSDATLATPVITPTNVTVSNLQQYYALVDNGSCTDTATITFSVLSLPVALDQTPPALCEDISGGGTAAGIDLTLLNTSINGGTGNAVSWFSDATLATPIATPTNITAADAQLFYALVDNGTCSDTATVTYTINTLPIANAGIDDTICSSLSYLLNPTTSVGNGTWSGGPVGTTFSPDANTPNATVTVPTDGTYTFTWTEDNSTCVDTDNLEITFSNMSFTADSTQSVCGQSSGSITVNVANGISPYQYSIDGGMNFQSSSIFNGLTANTYNLIVKDAANCQVTGTETVTNAISFTADIINTTNVSCNGFADGTIEVLGSDPLATYNYEWNTNPIQNTNIASNLDTGSYYCIVIDDNTGCVDTAFVSITQPDSVSISIVNINPDTVCINGSATITAIASNGSGAGYTYAWSGPNVNVTSTVDSLIVSPLTSSVYTVSAQDGNGCPSNIVSAFVYIYPSLNVIATSHDVAICPGESTTIDALGPYGGNGGPYTFTWDNGLGNGKTQTVSPAATTQYTVTVDDGCSPIASDTITITVNPVPLVSFVGDQLNGCESFDGFTVNFTNTTNPAMVDSAYWIFENSFTTDTNFFNVNDVNYSQAGSYDVSLMVTTPSAMGGCVGMVNYVDYITVYNLPIPDFTSNPNPVTMFNPTVEFIDQSYSNIQAWNWNFDGLGNSSENNPAFTFPSDTGNYWVTLTVTDQNSCIDSITKLVIVKGEYSIYVPNAFTPNSDNLNESFSPKGFGLKENGYSFSIFDRWGEKLFETNELNTGWDGTFKSELAPLGVYIWKLTYYDTNDIRHFEIGSVTLHY